MPASATPAKKMRGPSGLPPYLASLYEVPLLTREQEYHLFRKFNYLKYKATKLREKLDPSRARTSVMDEIEQLYDEAVQVKNQIVQANLRLVVSIAKRHVNGVGGFLRPGERRQHVADPGRGEVRLLARQQVQHVRQLGDHEELRPHDSGRVQAARSLPHQPGRDVHGEAGRCAATRSGRKRPSALREQQVERILSRLDEREQKIIISRFGLDHSREPLTLKEVGGEMGVTKERVRQIEARALDKARQAAAGRAHRTAGLSRHRSESVPPEMATYSQALLDVRGRVAC